MLCYNNFVILADPPTITSIFPSAPVNLTSSFTFTAPIGYNGPIITCSAIGWPTPTIEWLLRGENLIGPIFSDSTRRANSAFVSATLISQDEFNDTNTGDYSCILRANDTDSTDSRDITLKSSSNSPLTSNPLNCSVSSPVAFFQVRVLGTDCLNWDLVMKQLIAKRFKDTILSVVSAECKSCLVASDHVITNTPECSSQVHGAAVFRGMITTDNRDTTKDIFCALYSWQQNGPLVLVDNEFHLVDQSCSAKLESPAELECSAQFNSFSIIIISAGVAIGFLVLLILAILIVVCVCIYRMKKNRSKIEIYISEEPRSVYDR